MRQKYSERKIFFVIGFLVVFACLPLRAQKNQSDSLFNLYNTADSEKLQLKYLLSFIQNFRLLQADTLLKYSNRALVLANKLNSDTGKALANLCIGMGHQKQSDFNNAIEYYSTAEPLLKKEKLYDGHAAALFFRGVMQVYLGDYKSTLADFFTALEICEKNKITSREADILIGLANVYSRLENNKKCIEYNLKAIELIEKQPKVEYYSLVASYINLGGVYAQENDFNKAVNILQKAIALAEGKKFYDWEIKGHGNLAGVYLETNNTKEALKHLLIVVRLSENLNDQVSLSEAFLNLGNLYSKNNDKENSERYFLKALNITEGLNDIDALKNIYYSMYKLYYKFGEYKLSVDYLEKHLTLKDSLMSSSNVEQLNNLEAKYNNEKKEQLNKILQKDNLLKEAGLKFQKSVIFFVVVGLLIALVFLIFIFKGLKKQKEANTIISLQKQEVEIQKQKIEEHQKEIVDSITYAKKIQEALLPSVSYINKHLKNQ